MQQLVELVHAVLHSARLLELHPLRAVEANDAHATQTVGAVATLRDLGKTG